jgi:hypothetical protein
MWYPTGNGLCRYDGYTFKTYHNNPDDPHSINSENPNSLYMDRQENYGRAPGTAV